MREGASKVSIWWKDACLFGTWEGVKESFVREVCNGLETSFCNYCWVVGEPLCVWFPRLINLSIDKGAKVADIGEWVEGI